MLTTLLEDQHAAKTISLSDKVIHWKDKENGALQSAVTRQKLWSTLIHDDLTKSLHWQRLEASEKYSAGHLSLNLSALPQFYAGLSWVSWLSSHICRHLSIFLYDRAVPAHLFGKQFKAMVRENGRLESLDNSYKLATIRFEKNRKGLANPFEERN